MVVRVAHGRTFARILAPSFNSVQVQSFIFDRNELFFSVWLFGVLPFSFLLVEADGFSFGPQTGIRARLYEALVIFLLVFLLVIFLFCLIVSTITNISSQILFQCSNVPVVY